MPFVSHHILKTLWPAHNDRRRNSGRFRQELHGTGHGSYVILYLYLHIFAVYIDAYTDTYIYISCFAGNWNRIPSHCMPMIRYFGTAALTTPATGDLPSALHWQTSGVPGRMNLSGREYSRSKCFSTKRNGMDLQDFRGLPMKNISIELPSDLD